ncbi:sulfatase-like hydrolase/transferase [bacterium]|nr:sulfatase-like hydrolase/transferase [bacterium]
MVLAAACASAPLEAPTAGGAAGSAAPTAAANPVVSRRQPAPVVQAEDSYYRAAAAAVQSRIDARGVKPARNVILFVGDGMGISTITAARIWQGQQAGVDGESHRLAMEQLPWSAFSRTYTHDAQVADSAPTAAAMTTGVKSRNGTIGVTQAADTARCATARTSATTSLWSIAEDAGLATGVVSTARLTHATPAATFAQTTERDWEDDSQVPQSAKDAGCTDIAAQFIAWNAAHGDGFEVALAGGRRQFMPETQADPEYPNSTGGRKDGRDITAEWRAGGANRVYVDGREGFDAVNFASDVQVLGLFEPSHMQYEADRLKDRRGEPSIAEMTRAAITRLSRDPDGYVLMVEAGRIDHAHHAGNAARALADTDALDQAVAAALAMTDPSETLIIVTADHSHVFTIAGYPTRNNPILGLVQYPAGEGNARGIDGKPFTTLGYMNGPGSVCRGVGAEARCERKDLSNVDTTAVDFQQEALIPLASETHAGEDVAVFASGPGAELFSGVIEQNEIFHVMARASRLAK